MKYRNSDEYKKTTRRIPAIAILALVFALIMAACSVGTKTSEPKPAETNKAGVNNSSPNLTSTASSLTNSDLAGTYTVNGMSADGKNYPGEITVTKRDEVYQMSWKIGAESYDGVAVQSGNTLAAAYTTGTNGKGCGAVVYKINDDNSLDGIWGEWGVNSAGTEKVVPAGSVSNGVGIMDVSGTNADGSPYKGKLTVTKGANDVYQFTWDTGTKFIGTGVRMDRYLAAGSGEKQCGFVIYEVKGATLEGKWGVPGSTALGTEKAIKK